MTAPDTFHIIFIVMGLVIVPVVIYHLVGGELVGEMRCAYLQGIGMRTIRVRVQRFVARDGVVPRVQVQVRAVVLAAAWSYSPAEALALAKLLDDAAAEAEAA